MSEKKILHYSILTLSILWVVLTVIKHHIGPKLHVPVQTVTVKKDENISTRIATISSFLKRKNTQHFQIVQTTGNQIQLSIQKTLFSTVTDLNKQLTLQGGIIIQCSIDSDNNDAGVINVNSLVIQYPI